MLHIISSMATRQVLAELARQWQNATGIQVSVESVGGVDAAERVQSGETFDGVVLASDAIEKLATSGHVLAGSRVDLMRSSIAMAVKAGSAVPDISTEALLRSAIEAAPDIGYSTGPSGAALVKLLQKWGLQDALQSRMVQAPPGVPVGTLVARGEVALGFQQLSELMGHSGVSVVGTLPASSATTTLFSAAICAASMQSEIVINLLTFMAATDADRVKQKYGMQSATL